MNEHRDVTVTQEHPSGAAPAPRAADLSPPASPPGYELLDEIGRGGMGVVYRARDTALDRDVAVKLLSDRFPPDSPAAQRFLSEARITGQLQHPGIPGVHQVGTLAGGRPFLAMKLIKGSTLEAILKRQPDPSTDRGRLLAAFEAVCQAVGYAHAHRVIHRDLKPANVMVGAFGEVQVMDWGLAKILGQETPSPAHTLAAEQTQTWTEISPTPERGSDTQAGSLVGTPAFIAPEQAIGQIDRVNERSDVFGLGAILAVILTGEPPYVGESFEAVRVQAVRGTLDDCFARLDASGAEPEWVALCKKCLTFEPADRPADAGAVAQAVAGLRAAADERARRAELERVRVEGERATAEARAAERRKRRRLAVAAAAVLVAVLVTVTVTSLLAADHFNRLRLSEAQAAHGERDARHEAEQLADEARRRGDAERWQRYRANMAAAGSALQLQSGGAARRALAAAPAEFRDWEWLHFASRLDESRLVLPCGAANAVSRPMTFRPGDKQVAAGQADGTVRVWDVTTGREVAVHLGGSQGIREVAFGPDGQHLLSFSIDGTLQSWAPAAKDPQVLLRIPHQWAIGDVLSPDRRLLFSLSDQFGQVWDVATRRKRSDLPGRLPPVGVRCGVFSPDGRWLAYCTEENAVRVWDLEAGAEVHVLHGHANSVRALAFSPDGKRLASGCMYPENAARLWDLTTGKEIAALRGHRNEVSWVAFSPDGTRLATTSLDQTARLWDGVTGRAIATLEGHRGSVYYVAFRPGGRHLATGSFDGTVRLWDASGGEPVAVLHGHTGDVRRLEFDKGGALLASTSEDRTVRLWDMALAERNGVLRGHTSYVYDVAFSPDGTRAASAAWDGTVRLWDPTLCLQTRPPSALPAGLPPVNGVCFRPDGKQFASAGGDDRVRVWDADTGKLLRNLTCPMRHWRLNARAAFHPNGTMLAAGGRDGLIRLWGAEGDDPVATLAGHKDIVGDVAFRPDGEQLASGSVDKTVRLWKVAARQAVAVLQGHTDTVNRVAFSADGRLLASASEDKTVRLWDAATGETLAVLPHGSNVYGVAFHPRGTRLAAACADNTIRLWDVGVARLAGGKETPDAEVAELRGHEAYVHAVDWSPDGTRLISASGDGTVRVWDSLSVQERAGRTAAESK